ncbi:MAG: outer membrane protein assembly factor BamB, partial [Verrucomicrobiales bacterium]
MKFPFLCCGIFVSIAFLELQAQENWPRFRGSNAVSVADDDPRLPDKWSSKENVRWKTDVPGLGWSCPVIWGKRVFLTTVVCDEADANEAPKVGLYLGEGRKEIPKGTHHWLTYCFDIETGTVLWKQEAKLGTPPVGRHPKSTYASETPTTDGERLYVLFGDLGLWCYDMDGKELWNHHIESKTTMQDYGAAGSPVVHEDQVIVVYDNKEASYILALDTKTGKERWRTPRDEKTTWATPFVWKNGQRTEIVVNGKKRIRSYDLSGKLLWECGGKMSNLIIPSPFAAHDMVYVTSGYFADQVRPVYAIKAGATGDITTNFDDKETTNDYVKWYVRKGGPYNTSPIVYNGRYFTLLDRGMMTCHNAITGEEIFGRVRF